MQKINKINVVIVLLVLGLCVFGLVMIYSASSYSALARYGDKWYFVKKQAVGLLLGVVLFVVAYNFDYHIFLKIKWLVIALSVVALLLVFVPGIGISANGARRWIGFASLNLQSLSSV